MPFPRRHLRAAAAESDAVRRTLRGGAAPRSIPLDPASDRWLPHARISAVVDPAVRRDPVAEVGLAQLVARDSRGDAGCSRPNARSRCEQSCVSAPTAALGPCAAQRLVAPYGPVIGPFPVEMHLVACSRFARTAEGAFTGSAPDGCLPRPTHDRPRRRSSSSSPISCSWRFGARSRIRSRSRPGPSSSHHSNMAAAIRCTRSARPSRPARRSSPGIGASWLLSSPQAGSDRASAGTAGARSILKPPLSRRTLPTGSNNRDRYD